VREWVSRDFEEAFGEVDVIASPVAPTPAFKLGEQSASPLQMYLNDLYTIPANLAGLPAISIPAGRDSSGLPIGIQLMAAHHCELTLLAAGRALEES
jgi:aspartyl-tRNA(Asn)/glutamyl-tRNA(Gln) amidotransferase subunit A